MNFRINIRLLLPTNISSTIRAKFFPFSLSNLVHIYDIMRVDASMNKVVIYSKD